MTKPIIIKTAIKSTNCMSLEQGNILYPDIEKAIIAKEEIILDFSDIEFVATPFFNASLGQLMKSYSLEEVMSLVKLRNTPYDLKGMVKKVLENAQSFYKSANSDRSKEVIKNSVG